MRKPFDSPSEADTAMKQRFEALKARLEAAHVPAGAATFSETGRSPYERLPWRLWWRMVTYRWRRRFAVVIWLKLGWWFLLGTLRVAVFAGAAALLLYELREWHDDRLTRNWQLLATRTPGSGGKTEALEYLNSQFFCLPRTLEYPLIGENCWKMRASLKDIDLSADSHNGIVSLSGANLANANLFRANLGSADLRYVNFEHSNLRESSLRSANLVGAKLTAADFFRADLSYVNFECNYFFEPASTECGRAERSEFQHAILTSANFSGANFSNSDFFGADMLGFECRDCDFRAANLHDSQLIGADLSEASFVGANISTTNFFLTLLSQRELRRAWFFEQMPPKNISVRLIESLPVREHDEAWGTFVGRIMRDRPELGWTEDMKEFADRWG